MPPKIKLIRADQVVHASDLAKELTRTCERLKYLMGVLRHYDLHADANALCAARDTIHEVAGSLETKARAAFVAARAGEELPKKLRTS